MPRKLSPNHHRATAAPKGSRVWMSRTPQQMAGISSAQGPAERGEPLPEAAKQDVPELVEGQVEASAGCGAAVR